MQKKLICENDPSTCSELSARFVEEGNKNSRPYFIQAYSKNLISNVISHVKKLEYEPIRDTNIKDALVYLK